MLSTCAFSVSKWGFTIWNPFEEFIEETFATHNDNLFVQSPVLGTVMEIVHAFCGCE